ncbi:uncharacterized protein BDZ99DRAFT_514801 [Mytilinidion resinicola]|uniref:Uncharacterized protein n=1 Tax=Mytilinidion resinicola TaxID=574789 RepID=A0A6A6Z7G3_9PEZI|nr:uncharacterized protein BDZ99DRAFT_514801 [Mytilinidion resinicola]KAF2816195.1 hypothetical protein BDZ99DRAFT_514801 [Mytilinidion resinicola]
MKLLASPPPTRISPAAIHGPRDLAIPAGRPMPWPFGRRRATKLKVDGPAPVAEGKKPAAAYAGQRSGVMPDTSQALGRRISTRQSNRRKRRPSSRSDASLRDVNLEKHSSDLEPTHTASERQHLSPPASQEDITALPITKELGTSPHLRPVTQEYETPYNFQLQGQSHSSIPSARERGKLQRPQTLRGKRSANDPALPRRKSTKKRKNDHVREEEIRAMSMPLPQKRPAGNAGGGMLRRDSKKMRSGLNRHLERPTSNISLPVEESIHSSMSGGSESRAFRVSALDMFTPRPKIRLSGLQYSPGGANTSPQNPSRNESRKEKRATTSKDGKESKEALNKSRTIDDLADSLDAGALREIMDRDKRRREKKRKADEERIKRKLERRAEKQRAKEQAQAPGGTPAIVPQQATGSVGLGIQKEPSTPMHEQPATPKPDPMETESSSTYLNYPASGQISSNPFENRELEIHRPIDEVPTPLESPFEEPIVADAQEVRYSRASMSPPTSPVHHARGISNVSYMPDLLSEMVTQQPVQSVEPVPTPQEATSSRQSLPIAPTEVTPQRTSARRSSEASGKRAGVWASIFRRGGKRSSIDQGRTTPSEHSFSNTSRESMSRQPPPAHLVGPPQVRRTSGTPVRTMSKFKEDLPDFPLSPPDSRVQSPEVYASSSKPIAARRGNKQPSSIHIEGGSRPGSKRGADALITPTDDVNRNDSPVSPGGRASRIMSQSLASVDSEGSWLSGKPVKRRSNQVHVRSSVGSAVTPKQHEDFNASYEELGIPDDEYFRRLTPQPDEKRRSAQSGELFTRKPSSTAMAPTAGSDTDDDAQSNAAEKLVDQETVHSGVARQPTVVHRNPRVKSTEALVTYFQADEASAAGSSPSNVGESPDQDRESPTEEQPVLVQRARSVDLGNHVRHLSAGSAKLLDIPARGSSVDQRRASSTSHKSRASIVE